MRPPVLAASFANESPDLDRNSMALLKAWAACSLALTADSAEVEAARREPNESCWRERRRSVEVRIAGGGGGGGWIGRWVWGERNDDELWCAV